MLAPEYDLLTQVLEFKKKVPEIWRNLHDETEKFSRMQMRIWWDLKEVYPKAMRKYQKLLDEDEEDDEVLSINLRNFGVKSQNRRKAVKKMNLLKKTTQTNSLKTQKQKLLKKMFRQTFQMKVNEGEILISNEDLVKLTQTYYTL